MAKIKKKNKSKIQNKKGKIKGGRNPSNKSKLSKIKKMMKFLKSKPKKKKK